MNEAFEILLATMNGERYLREQLDSILAQTDGNWHLTISDDGSTDGTGAIIEEYVGRHPDRIARHCPGRRFGSARDHFFHLMRACPAEHLMFCDQDDVWYPDKVKTIRRAMREAEAQWGEDTPILVFSDQTPTDADLRPLAPSLMRYQKQYFGHFDFRSILMQNVVTGGAMAVNRSLVRLGGRCGDVSRVRMHDWWLAAVAARFGKIVYIDRSLGAYRQHDRNVEGAKAVGSAGYIARRTGALGEVRRTILTKKAQAAEFRSTYGAELTDGDLAFLRAFERPRSGPLFWLRYQHLMHGAVRKAGMLALC